MKNINKPICSRCVNNEICLGDCEPVKWINGNAKSKEVLLSNLVNTQNIEYKDYKETLSELSDDKENRLEGDFERVRELVEGMRDSTPSFYHKRKIAIIALLLLGYTKKDISIFFKIDYSLVYRIIK